MTKYFLLKGEREGERKRENVRRKRKKTTERRGTRRKKKESTTNFFLQHWLPASITTPLQFTHAVVDGVIDGTQNIKP